MSKTRPNLSDEIKYYIKFMHKFMKWSPEVIFKHPSLSSSNKIQKRTVQYWIKRIDETDGIERIKQKGAKRILSANQEKDLVKYIDSNNQKSYNQVKIDTRIDCTPRTVNNYALRNGISKSEKSFRFLNFCCTIYSNFYL